MLTQTVYVDGAFGGAACGLCPVVADTVWAITWVEGLELHGPRWTCRTCRDRLEADPAAAVDILRELRVLVRSKA